MPASTTPPPLRTILDLDPATELVEIPVGNPRLRVVMDIARGEMDRVTRSAEEAECLVDETLAVKSNGRMPEQIQFVTRLMVRRLAVMCPRTRVSGPMLGVAAALTGGNPAVAVMWAHALAAWDARTGTPASVANVVVRHLDGCVPAEHALRHLWESQKLDAATYREFRAVNSGAMDNWLDYLSAWSPEALRAGESTPSR